uniref:Kyphoscoliosis peptidase n=1 Tax=Aceria tosichella TaxID=561515 RepID=A0A6G1S7H5_9ACAR
MATRASSKTHNTTTSPPSNANHHHHQDRHHHHYQEQTMFSNVQLGRPQQSHLAKAYDVEQIDDEEEFDRRSGSSLLDEEGRARLANQSGRPNGLNESVANNSRANNTRAPNDSNSGGLKLLPPSSSSSVSPSSLQSLTTDSDSLHGGEPAAAAVATLAISPSSSSSSSPIEHSSPSSAIVPTSSTQQHAHRSSQSKSPILVKYNYYDYNGERQANYDLQTSSQQRSNGAATSGNNNQRIQRQLSPTFKQSLDQIVRSSQQHMTQQSSTTTSPVSPRGSPNGLNGGGSQTANGANPTAYTMTLLARRYKLSSYEHRCLRCGKTVYQMDKVGPLKDFTFYHQNCFKCRECGTKLTLKTYFNSQHSSTDQEVYCHRHCPKTPAGKLDNQSVGIRAALNAPKVFDPIHQEQFLVGNGGNGNSNNHQQQFGSQVDSRALHIQHAVKQTKLQAIYKHSQVDKKISQFLNRRLEYLEPKQKMLEMRHREEEEQLFKVFEQKWLQEESSIRDQIREEWQRELNKLLEKYKRQLSSSAANLNFANNNNIEAAAAAAVAHQHHQAQSVAMKSYLMDQKQRLIGGNAHQQQQGPNHHHHNQQQQQKTPSQTGRLDFHRIPIASDASNGVAVSAAVGLQEAAGSKDQDEQKKMIELERMNLEKTMTIKLDRKKETLKRKLKEFERQATAELVEKQSREMITLISLKLEEFKEEQKRKIGSDLEQFEAIESLANHLGASLQVTSASSPNGAGDKLGPAGLRVPSPSSGRPTQLAPHQAAAATNNNTEQSRRAASTNRPIDQSVISPMLLQAPLAPGAPPLPKAPQLSKMELYNSDQPDELFREIDELAINVAKEDQRTFTDLVHHLTRHCLTDVEKVRAIFRWITVKNLNTMEFDSSIKPDTPLGLLRGIKQGSESYHVLFKRLCSYAGLHCVVIKGYSKSAGYQPGVRFEGNRFRNSWNAVYVAGAWRFVQCNWGARHLVSVAVMQDKNSNNNNKTQNNGRSCQQQQAGLVAARAPIDLTPAAGVVNHQAAPLAGANLGRRGLASSSYNASMHQHQHDHSGAVNHLRSNSLLSPASPTCSSSASSSCSYSSSSSCSSPATASHSHLLASSKQTNHHQHHQHHHHHHRRQNKLVAGNGSPPSSQPANGQSSASGSPSDSLRYEYDDHYFLTDPDEFIYEFFPLAPEWQLLKTRPISLQEFEQLPFVRSLFFKYGLYFPQADIRSVLYTNSSGATTIKIGMPTHMIPSLIFHYNLKYFDSDLEHHDGISLKRFVMQSVESGNGSPSSTDTGANLLSNIVSFRVHVPENGAYILDIFANSTTPNQYITGEPMKFKSVCKFKIIARNLKTVMVPLPDCASGEYGPMKATRLFGIIPLTHENGLISVQNDKRFLEIQFRMTRPLLDFMASLHKNGYDERQLSKLIKIFIDGDIVFIAIKFHEDGQYGLDIYTRDQQQQQQLARSDHHNNNSNNNNNNNNLQNVAGESGYQAPASEPKKQLLTHCCKYLINVRATAK